MIAYKGFNKDMTCRGFQFEQGKTYEEDEAILCQKGFHACEAPLDIFAYYPPASSVYHEVTLSGLSNRKEEDSKVCGNKIKIGARIDIAGLCKAQFEYVKKNCTNENNVEQGKQATAGYRGAATAGYSGAATAGDRGAALSRGASSVGENGAALARGSGVKVKGGMGAIIVAVEERLFDGMIESWCSGVVDGETLKPDVWYRCENGKFIEETEEQKDA